MEMRRGPEHGVEKPVNIEGDMLMWKVSKPRVHDSLIVPAHI